MLEAGPLGGLSQEGIRAKDEHLSQEILMKSLMQLLECLLSDEGRQCSTATSKDVETLRLRVEHEGLSFVTITLPGFCTDFERSLAIGRVDSTFFRRFKKNGRIPAFLQGFVSRVFDKQSGVLLDEPDIGCIRAVRQICLFAKKIHLECSKSRTTRALQNFVEWEADREWQSGPAVQWDLYDLVARRLWCFPVDGSFRSNFWEYPKHGPGATSEKVTGNSKYTFKKWHSRLDACFPVDFFRYANVSHLEDTYDGISRLVLLGPEQEIPVRVVPVPKTLKAPRDRKSVV